MKHINQRVMLTKRLLREGLFQLLKTKPLEKITVSELCLKAGINRATFYKYYGSPRDVLTESGKEFAERIKSEVSRPDNWADAERYLADICAYLYVNAETVKIYIRYNTDDAFLNMIREFNEELLRLKQNITSLQRMDEDSVRLVSTFFGCRGYFLLRQWIVDGIDKTPEQIAKILCGVISRG